MIIARHGGSSHYVRPDAVYKTGVLQSIVGYSPQQDVMDVAAAFTQGPYAFQQGSPMSSGVSGLGVVMRKPASKAAPMIEWVPFTNTACPTGFHPAVERGPDGNPYARCHSNQWADALYPTGTGVAGPRVTLLGPIQFLGLGSVQNYGLIQRGWLKLKAWFASKNAAAFQTAVAAAPMANPTIAPIQVAHDPYLQYGPSFPSLPTNPRGMQGLGGIIPYGPRQWAGQQVVPSNAGRVGMLIAMQEKNQPAEIAQSNSDAIQQRWDYMRSPVR
jgi:hypothetical protein